MSQHDMTVDNGSGLGVRTDINSALQALASLSSGASAPSPSFPCQLWADTGTSRLRRRNIANTAWVDVGPLDAALRDAASQGGFVADTGAVNAYVCNFVPVLTARSESTPLRFKVANANSTASTINDGVGTVALVGSTHAPLIGGELIANGIAWIQWNASVGAYVLLFCTGAAGPAVNQVQTAFTTAGTAPSFTLTPVPAIQGYAAPQRFRVKFHSAGAGSDTINVSGRGTKNLKQYDSSGAKVAATIAAGQLTDLEYDGTDWLLMDPLPADVASLSGRVTTLENIGKPITKEYVSAPQTIVAGGALTLPHGLGVKPKFVSAYVVCQIATGNWAVGDEAFFRLDFEQSSASVTTFGFTVKRDATNLVVRFAANGIFMIDASTGAYITTGITNFKMVFEAWA
ncbi:hypothetical protein [Pseudomonas sp. BF-R-12]|uniref:hypothetical protein n=1 Tax=Pseudomonas sp. BF-R-12 TaxID=2832363 RepID=UPI001CBEBB58|nr:hypothetical protein [Pseudomonas sp. BF-R-12]